VHKVIRPNYENYNPDPYYIRKLLDIAGESQRSAAKLIGITPRTMRYYVSLDPGCYRPAPYPVQFALECLAGLSGTLEASNHQGE
jgi:hypothetical protein